MSGWWCSAGIGLSGPITSYWVVIVMLVIVFLVIFVVMLVIGSVIGSIQYPARARGNGTRVKGALLPRASRDALLTPTLSSASLHAQLPRTA